MGVDVSKTEGSMRLIQELRVHQAELEMQNEELNRTRDELEQALKNYTDLYDFAPVGYFSLSRDGTIRAVNLTGTQLLSVERSRLIGRSLLLLFFAESRRIFSDFLDKVFAGEGEQSCEVILTRKDLPPLHVQINGNLVGDECFAAVMNITERKELEKQLLHAQKMESLGLFVGGVAHDFNNLLTAISGYGEAIRESDPEDPEIRDSLAAILEAADRAAELTRGLLAFGRREEINRQPVNLCDVVVSTEKLIRKLIGEHIRVETSLPDKKLTIMADSSQLSQVLMNLAANARDAMPTGGRLSITVEEFSVKPGLEARYELPAPGRYARLSLADTGTGISEVAKARMFEPFYTTKEVGKGTGLGLSIVYGIIRQHGGSVTVSSSQGAGTTFNIYLPLIEGKVHDKEEASAVTGGTETVLVVEDDQMVRTFLERVLVRAGYKIITAANGTEALEKFVHDKNIALVVSDLLMPEKTGIELQEDMNRIRPGTKTLFISGYTGDMVNLGRKREGTSFLKKPFNKNQLLGKMRELLDGTT